MMFGFSPIVIQNLNHLQSTIAHDPSTAQYILIGFGAGILVVAISWLILWWQER